MSLIKQLLTHKDVKIKGQTLIHDGFFRVESRDLECRRFDSSWSSEFSRELIVKPAAVAVLPYDPINNKVVLIEQFRIGALEKDRATPWLLEIVAGIKDKEDEPDEITVRREMLEETCLDVEDLIPIYDYFTTPGGSTERIKLFCAKVDSSKSQQFCGLKEENEDIQVHVVQTEDAFAAVRSGQVNNGFTIIALQWLELNLQVINDKWQ